MECPERGRLQRELEKAKELYTAASIAGLRASDLAYIGDNVDAARSLYDAAMKKFSEHIQKHKCTEM